jgi:hypothetical protein
VKSRAPQTVAPWGTFLWGEQSKLEQEDDEEPLKPSTSKGFCKKSPYAILNV